jgi:hypothetical protein
LILNTGNRPPSANYNILINPKTGQKMGIGGVGVGTGGTGVGGLSVASSTISGSGVSGVGLQNL